VNFSNSGWSSIIEATVLWACGSDWLLEATIEGRWYHGNLKTVDGWHHAVDRRNIQNWWRQYRTEASWVTTQGNVVSNYQRGWPASVACMEHCFVMCVYECVSMSVCSWRKYLVQTSRVLSPLQSPTSVVSTLTYVTAQYMLKVVALHHRHTAEMVCNCSTYVNHLCLIAPSTVSLWIN